MGRRCGGSTRLNRGPVLWRKAGRSSPHITAYNHGPDARGLVYFSPEDLPSSVSWSEEKCSEQQGSCTTYVNNTDIFLRLKPLNVRDTYRIIHVGTFILKYRNVIMCFHWCLPSGGESSRRHLSSCIFITSLTYLYSGRKCFPWQSLHQIVPFF